MSRAHNKSDVRLGDIVSNTRINDQSRDFALNL
jgi:hypothetical protein